MKLRISTTKFGNKKITCPECPDSDILYSKFGDVYLLRFKTRYKECKTVSQLLDYVAVTLKKYAK